MFARLVRPHLATDDLTPLKTDLLTILQLTTLGGILYGALVAAFGKPFLPGGSYFTVLLIWATAHAGGHLLSRLLPVFPPLLGMLASGILLKNLPGTIVDGLPYKVESSLRYGCIAICFLMSGLEADLCAMRSIGGVAVRLLLLPGIVEACVAGGVAAAVFGMTGATGALFALALGFVIKPCDPTIVISACAQYQKRGIGVAKRIPSLLVASASFDDIVAIALYTVCITLGELCVCAVGGGVFSRGDGATHFPHPPPPTPTQPSPPPPPTKRGTSRPPPCSSCLAPPWGLLPRPCARSRACGAPAACASPPSWSPRWPTCSSKFHLSGAGVLASIVGGAATAAAWGAGFPRFASTGPNAAHATVVEHAVASIWQWIAAPLLFGIVGTQCEFAKINGARVPRSLAVIFAGWLARVPATLLSVSCGGFTPREKMFIALNWLPKATVQSALASAPLDRILAENPNDATLLAWGEDALVTALLSVLICGPLAVIVVALGGPRLMTPDGVEAGGGGSGGAAEPAATTATKLPSSDLDALAAMPHGSTVGGGRARMLASMSNLLPAAWASTVAVGGRAAAATVGGAAATAIDEDDDTYQDALLADVDAVAHSLLEEVELAAWSLDAPGADTPSAADAAAAAARLRLASAGLRRHLLAAEAAGIERVDGAREFFRQLAVVDGEERGGGVRRRRAAGGGGEV